MKNLYIIILLSIFSCKTAQINGQQNRINKKAEDLYHKAIQYSFERKNEFAIDLLNQAIAIEPEYLDANMILAKLYQMNIKDYKKALEVYDNIERFSPNNFEVKFQKSFCYFYEKNYEAAAENISVFLSSELATGKKKQKGEMLQKNIHFSKKATENSLEIEFVNIGAAINSEHDEYFPSVTSDNEMIYFTVKKVRDNYPNEDIYSSQKINGKWTARKPISERINSNMNEGAHCVSASGKYLMFASDNYKYGNEGRIDIYIAKKEGNDWLSPANMGRNINTRMWDSQPVLSADSRSLYFVSNKKGGTGGSDIYISKLGEDRKFGLATNLSQLINTPFDEQRPYLHPDGKTLYFSSDGHAGMGGKDLFKSILSEDGSWSEPINLGYPINTKGDELGIFVSADGKTAYISSDREGGYGGQDIYSFELPQDLRPELVSYVKGVVLDKKTKDALLANIKIFDLKTGELFTSFSSDKINGKFLATILGGKEYAFTAEAKGYLPFSENVSLKTLKDNESFVFDIALESFAVGKEFVLKNIFFNTGAYNLLDISKTELDYLVGFLKANENLKIEIGGHTDNVGNASSNQSLSKQRAHSVKNYLVAKGISADRLSAQGYGDTLPIVANDSDENKAKNRRTSFKIIS